MFAIGKVVKPQGVRGEVKIEIITSFPKRFYELSRVYTERNDFEILKIQDVRVTGNFAFLRFENITSIDEAEKLRNAFLYIPENELYPLEKDEYYLYQLVGLDIVDENDNLLGKLVDVESYPVNDVYVMEDRLGKRQMFPAIKDVVKKIDLDSGKMTIRVMDGLFD